MHLSNAIPYTGSFLRPCDSFEGDEGAIKDLQARLEQLEVRICVGGTNKPCSSGNCKVCCVKAAGGERVHVHQEAVNPQAVSAG